MGNDSPILLVLRPLNCVNQYPSLDWLNALHREPSPHRSLALHGPAPKLRLVLFRLCARCAWQSPRLDVPLKRHIPSQAFDVKRGLVRQASLWKAERFHSRQQDLRHPIRERRLLGAVHAPTPHQAASALSKRCAPNALLRAQFQAQREPGGVVEPDDIFQRHVDRIEVT